MSFAWLSTVPPSQTPPNKIHRSGLAWRLLTVSTAEGDAGGQHGGTEDDGAEVEGVDSTDGKIETKE